MFQLALLSVELLMVTVHGCSNGNINYHCVCIRYHDVCDYNKSGAHSWFARNFKVLVNSVAWRVVVRIGYRFHYLRLRELAESMSDEELLSLPLEIQQAVASQRLEGLELPREVILDSLRQIRGEVSIDEPIRKYKTR